MREFIAGLMVLGCGANAYAAEILTSSFSGGVAVGTSSVQQTSTANPTAIDLVVSDGSARSLGYFYAETVFGGGGALSFLHDEIGYGKSSGSGTTIVRDVFRNDGTTDANYALRTRIIPGTVALAAILIASPESSPVPSASSGTPVTRLDLASSIDFRILLDGVAIYSAAASLETGGGSLSDITSGEFLALTGLTRIEQFGLVSYSWDATDLTLDLGSLAPGASRGLEYVLMTDIMADTRCVPGNVGCGAARSTIGDPRGGGTIIGYSSFVSFLSISVDPIAPSPVPTPPALALLGLGMAALVARRTRR